MRVQLSPWEVLETSLPFPSEKRRKRSSNAGRKSDLTSLPYALAVAASFVTGRRPRHSKKARHGLASNPEDLLPTLVVTLGHHIAVVGKSPTSQGGSTDWQVSSLLQSASRPGQATAFLPSNNSTDSKKRTQTSGGTVTVPAVFDAKHEEGYALQNGNTRLVCWPASEENGAADNDPTKLTAPAVSLALLTVSSKKSIVYGSLEDTSLYIARNDPNQDGKLQIQFIPSLETPLLGSDAKFVGTMARLVRPVEEPNKIGSKRKATTNTDSDDAMIHQLFVNKHAVILVRRTIDASMEGSAGSVETSRPEESVVIDLVHASAQKSTVIERASLLGFFDETGTATLSYTCQETVEGATNGHSKIQRQYYATVSLEDGELIGTPIELAPTARHVGLVGQSLLVVRTVHDELVMYDTARGGQIHRELLHNVGVDTRGDILISTDPKRGRLAVLFARGDKLCVAIASVKLDSSTKALVPNHLSLAAGLASTMEMSKCEYEGIRWHGTDHLTAIGSASASARAYNKVHGAVIRQAAAMLDNAFQLICDGSKDTKKAAFLLDVYESAVAMVAKATEYASSSETKETFAGNPQDDIPSREGEKVTNRVNPHYKMNGKVDKDSLAKENLVNGMRLSATLTARAHTPQSIPAAFVDHATSLVIQILLLPAGHERGTVKDEARLLLQQLFCTRKVSARSQFRSDPRLLVDLLRSLETAEGEKNTYTPVKLIFDTLRCCKDVSEKQMVMMLHFMIAKALPGDVAAWFLQDSNMSSANASKTAACRYVSLRDSKKDIQECESLSTKLILAGTKALFEKIFGFSDCNETLLRGALADGIPPRELGLLYQILVESSLATNMDASKTRRALHWASALCDKLRGGLLESEAAVVSRVQKSVASELAKTECILALEGTLRQFLTSIETRDVSRPKASDAPSRDRLPPYQIERLAF